MVLVPYLFLGATVVRTSDPCLRSVRVGGPNASEGDPRLHQPSGAEATSPFCFYYGRMGKFSRFR
jgi:hypothetical protein